MIVLRAIALSLVLGASASFPLASWAENTASGVDVRVAALLGQERAALGAVRKRHLERILTRNVDDAARTSAERLFDPGWLRSLPKPEGGEGLRCLARAVYFEARGEDVVGQFAVAEVILNRVESPLYPNTICGVVNQGRERRNACQFSFTCDGNPETISEPEAYAIAERIARLMKDGTPRELTDGATHFHTTAVNPRWARRFPQTARIGSHLFYRQPGAVRAN
jgi:spore germination cell wall hydrolase CwlJ-like protein